MVMFNAKIVALVVLMCFLNCSSQKLNSSDDAHYDSGNKSAEKLLVGATLNHKELGTLKETLFLKYFKYLTPANAAKQAKIHPEPDKWSWNKIDDFIGFAEENKLKVRIHGPVSPQASKWAKNDTRTAIELEQNMTEFLTESCKKFNDIEVVDWMDVVNETILKNGNWFGPKPGVNKWENPWLQMGLDENGFPLYILKAFDIATKNAPNVKLVYNQNGGMEAPMWDRLKETVLYLRSKGYRVDGIGWQAHLLLGAKREDFVMNRKSTMRKLAKLIDWAHQNNLAFHVTELDYLVKEGENMKRARTTQAKVYQAIVDVLLEKSKNGEVTLNLWDLGERYKKGTGYFQSIHDAEGNPIPALNVIKNVIDKLN